MSLLAKCRILSILAGACLFPTIVKPQTFNDACTPATTLMLDGSTSSGNTIGSSPFMDWGSCGPERDVETPAVWYKFLGQGRRVTVSTCSESTDFFTSVYAWKGSCNQSLRCISGSFGDFGCRSDNGASVTFDALEDVTYSILVSGRDRNDTGSFQISANQGNYLSVNKNDSSLNPSPMPAIDATHTQEPTASSLKLTPCASEMQVIASLSILTGPYAEFIDILLTDLSTNRTVWDSKNAVYLSNELYTFVECLDVINCFKFYIGDYGNSSYRFTFDGVSITSNNDDEQPFSVYYFGGGCTDEVSTMISITNTTSDDSGDSSCTTPHQGYLAVVIGGIVSMLMLVAV